MDDIDLEKDPDDEDKEADEESKNTEEDTICEPSDDEGADDTSLSEEEIKVNMSIMPSFTKLLSSFNSPVESFLLIYHYNGKEVKNQVAPIIFALSPYLSF